MIVATLLVSLLAQAPSTYTAVTDRGPRSKPKLVDPGPAGTTFTDPAFGARILRVTDRNTRSDRRGVSFRTASSGHTNEWSANASYFFVTSTDGAIVPFAFDANNGSATRLDLLAFYFEPQFSYVSDSLIYGSVSNGSLLTIDQYDFSTRKYTRLLNLESLESNLEGTFIGGISSSGGPTERILAFFGGTAQDLHHYVVVFDKDAPSRRQLLDTAATLNFNLHHAAIDRSGRYVLLYPTSDDLEPPRNAAQIYVWDTQANTKTPLPLLDARSGGHDAYGYGIAVNQDCCSSTSWDAAQWQIRSLARPLTTKDLIGPVLNPEEVYLDSHSSWNNARPDVAVPFIAATYRYPPDDVEWRPWDDEIIAVQTDAGDKGGDVYRFAHHRSDVRDDTDPSLTSFWYLPRPNVSRDGRWVLFTSNWEKTLGTDPAGDPSERARQDVFLIRIAGRSTLQPCAPDTLRLQRAGCISVMR